MTDTEPPPEDADRLNPRPQEWSLVTAPGRACPACGAEILLSATVPHGWYNTHGDHVHGTTEISLCGRCDADDPAAGPIVTFFIVHTEIPPDAVPEFAELLRHWVDHARPPKLDIDALNAEAEAYRRGEL